tara:strand:- start:91316 stop:92230 length:915 start_codon:yes stop_codon:yes gene_type:complete
MNSVFWQGFWRLSDPKISLASFAGLFLAACFAAADYGLNWGLLALTVLGVFCVEVAKNASGEVIDFDSGTDLNVSAADRSPFSGGKRVLVDELLSRRQTWVIAAVFFLCAIGIGLGLVVFVDARILWFGLPGIALAWYYHGGSLRLSYRGLGETAVAIAYGPLIVNGAYFVQTGALNAPLLHASGVLGLLVAAFLWINQYPDYLADRAAGKKNLVVRLGRQRAAVGFVALLLTAYVWLAITLWYYPTAAGVAGGFVGAVPAAFAGWRLLHSDSETARIIPAQAACLLSFIGMAAGAGTGYLLLG